MLELEGVTAGYGETVVLRDVTISVPGGSVVALLGPNGAGKTTTLRVAAGLITPRQGRVMFDGVDVTGQRPHEMARRGLCHLPEGHGIFPSEKCSAVGQSARPVMRTTQTAKPVFTRHTPSMMPSAPMRDQTMMRIEHTIPQKESAL